MPASFNLTAVINAKLGNVSPIINDLKKQISNIGGSVDFTVSKGSGQRISALNKSLPELSKNLRRVQIAAEGASSALNKLNTSANLQNLSNVKVQFANIEKATKSASRNIKDTTDNLEKFGQQAGLATRRFAAFLIGTAAIFTFTGAVKNAVKEAIDFQSEMVKLSIVTGKSLTQISGISQEISRLSTNFGASSAELAKVSVTLAQAGLSAVETKSALETLAKTSVVGTFGKITDTTQAAIAALRQFNLPVSELDKILSKVNAVAAAFAVEADDIATAIVKSGGAFKSAGGNIDELIALFTSVRSTTRETADTIATGFRTIFARIQRKDTIDFLKNFNIQLEEAGKFVKPLEAVKRLGDALRSLPEQDIRRIQIVEEVGGIRQISKVLPLLEQVDVTQQALAVSQAGSNSLTTDAAKAQNSLAIQLQKVREEFHKVFRTLGDSQFLKTTTTALLNIATAFNRVAESASSFIVALGAIAAFKIGQGIPKFAKGISEIISPPKNKDIAIQDEQKQVNHQQRIAAFSENSTALSQNTLALRSLGQVISQLAGSLSGRASPNPNVITTARSFGNKLPKGLRGLATGGIVAGSGNRDTELIAATPGEFIVNKKDSSRNIGLLKAINSGRIKAFASGGIVGGPTGNEDINNSLRKLSKSLGTTVDQLLKNLKKFNRGISTDLTGPAAQAFFTQEKLRVARSQQPFIGPQQLHGPDLVAALLRRSLNLPPTPPSIETFNDPSESQIAKQDRRRNRKLRRQQARQAGRTNRTTSSIIESAISSDSLGVSLGPNRSQAPFGPFGGVSSIDRAITQAKLRQAKSQLFSSFNLPRDRSGLLGPNKTRASNQTINKLKPAILTTAEKLAIARQQQAIGFAISKEEKLASINRKLNVANSPNFIPVTQEDIDFNRRTNRNKIRNRVPLSKRLIGSSFSEIGDTFQGFFGGAKTRFSNFIGKDSLNRIGGIRGLGATSRFNQLVSGFGGLGGRISSGFGGISSRLPKIPPSISGLTKKIGGASSTAALATAFLAPQLIGSTLGDSVESAPKSGRGRAKFGASLTAGLTTGVTAGLLTGNPLIGLGVGLSAFVITLKQQEEKIKQLEFSEKLDEFTEKVKEINAGLRPLVGTFDDIKAGLLLINNEIERVAPSLSQQGQGTFEATRSLFGADIRKERFEAQKQALGERRNELPQLIVFANKLVEAKGSVEAFKTGTDGLGNSLVELIANIRGEKTSVVTSELEANLKALQESKKKQEEFSRSLSESINVTNRAFNLLSVAQEAAESIKRLDEQTEHLANSFGGAIPSLDKLSFNVDSGGLSPQKFKEDINSVLGVFGDSGQSLRDNIIAFDTASRQLPTILENVIKGQDIFPKISSELEKEIGGGLGKEIARKITNLAEGIFEGGESEFRAEVRKNSKGVSEKILSEAGIDDQLKAVSEISKIISDNFTKLSSSIVRSVQFQLEVDQKIRDLGEARLNIEKQRAEFSGRSLSLSSLNAPFVTNQERLTGGVGVGLNVDKIAEELIGAESEVNRLRSLINRTAKENPADPELKKLGTQFRDAAVKTQRLGQALDSLATSTTFLTNAQSKLEEANASQQQILGFTDKLLFSDAASRSEIFPGLNAGLQALQQGNLANIPDLLRPQVKSFFDEFSEVEFGGKKGKEIFADIRRVELDRILPPNLQGRQQILDTLGNKTSSKQNDLQSQVIEALKLQEAAIQKQLEISEQKKSEFFDSATNLFDSFVKNLDDVLNNFNRNELERDIAGKRGDLEAAQGRVNAIEKLKEFGVQNAEEVTNLQNNFEKLQKLNQTRSDIAGLSGVESSLKVNKDDIKRSEVDKDVFGRSTFSVSNFIKDFSSDFSEQFSRLNLSSDEQDKIKSNIFSNLSGRTLGKFRGETPERQAQIVQDVISREINRGILDKRINLETEQNTLREKLQKNLPNININEASSNLDIIKKQFEIIGNLKVGDSLQKFTDAVDIARGQLEGKQQELFGLPPAVNRARGGPISSIFKPKGPDVIPAMLSKGEYVINPKSTKANYKLLEAINNSKGTKFASNGGLISYFADGGSVSRDAQRARRLKDQKKLFDDTNKRREKNGLSPLPLPAFLGGTTEVGFGGVSSRLPVLSGRAAQVQRGTIQRGETAKTLDQFDFERLRTIREDKNARNNDFRSATGRKTVVLPPAFRIGGQRDESKNLEIGTQLDRKVGNRNAPGNLETVFFLDRRKRNKVENQYAPSGQNETLQQTLSDIGPPEDIFDSNGNKVGINLRPYPKSGSIYSNITKGERPPNQIAIDFATQKRAQGLARARFNAEGGANLRKEDGSRYTPQEIKERFNRILAEETEDEFDRREQIARGVAQGKTINDILGIDSETELGGGFKGGDREAKSFADVEAFRRAQTERIAGIGKGPDRLDKLAKFEKDRANIEKIVGDAKNNNIDDFRKSVKDDRIRRGVEGFGENDIDSIRRRNKYDFDTDRVNADIENANRQREEEYDRLNEAESAAYRLNNPIVPNIPNVGVNGKLTGTRDTSPLTSNNNRSFGRATNSGIDRRPGLHGRRPIYRADGGLVSYFPNGGLTKPKTRQELNKYADDLLEKERQLADQRKAAQERQIDNTIINSQPKNNSQSIFNRGISAADDARFTAQENKNNRVKDVLRKADEQIRASENARQNLNDQIDVERLGESPLSSRYDLRSLKTRPKPNFIDFDKTNQSVDTTFIDAIRKGSEFKGDVSGLKSLQEIRAENQAKNYLEEIKRRKIEEYSKRELSPRNPKNSFPDLILDSNFLDDRVTRARRYNEGGIVDNIPAMLTKGEFVLNKSATSRIGPNNLLHLNRGGYLADGGVVNNGLINTNANNRQGGVFGGLSMDESSKSALSSFNNSVTLLNSAIQLFSNNKGLTDALNSFPHTLEITGKQTVEVVVNGAEILTTIMPEIRDMIASQTQLALSKKFKSAFGGEGNLEAIQ